MKMNQSYLYFQDERTQNEKELSKKITQEFTNLNIKRVESIQKYSNLPENDPCHRRNFLYVCFSGIPPKKEEFDRLGIQGERIYFFPQGNSPDISEEEARAKIQLAPLEKQVAIIHQQLRYRADKRMVFVYHSFGSILVATLFRLYYSYYFSRVIGIISIGCYPIRFHPILVGEVEAGYGKTLEQLAESADSNYQSYIKTFEQLDIKPEKNKYSYLCRNIAFSQGIGFSEMFKYTRQLPPFLKCFIYGREDQVFGEDHLSEVAVFYCYKRKLSSPYEARIQDILFKRYGTKVENVQQRFVYNISEGKHSVHWQKKYQLLLCKIIDEYLSILEEIHSQTAK